MSTLSERKEISPRNWPRWNGTAPLPDKQYNEWWLARVKARCVVDSNGCWIWQGNKTYNGYGQTGYRSKTRILHRKMFEVVNGVTLGRWEYACHSCDVKLCCNPAHLRKGTPLDNQVDSVMKRRNGEQQVTHCPRGHEYTPENTYVHAAKSGRPARNCKRCNLIRTRLKAGWPEHLAVSLPSQQLGYRPPELRTKGKR